MANAFSNYRALGGIQSRFSGSAEPTGCQGKVSHWSSSRWHPVPRGSDEGEGHLVGREERVLRVGGI